jgi:pyruvate/2-oxoglutarate dehydrogenase complex dihydrolipoamide dehydrogenase (E3) component
MVGCEVADWLGIRRKEVTLVKMRPGTELAEDVISPWLMDRLEEWKVVPVVGPREGVRVKEITDEGVVIIRDGKEETIAADNMVLALGITPVNQLVEQLKGKVAEIHVIGDAKEPRKAVDAIGEGSVVARQI